MVVLTANSGSDREDVCGEGRVEDKVCGGSGQGGVEDS